jgi:hypothetical protein
MTLRPFHLANGHASTCGGTRTPLSPSTRRVSSPSIVSTPARCAGCCWMHLFLGATDPALSKFSAIPFQRFPCLYSKATDLSLFSESTGTLTCNLQNLTDSFVLVLRVQPLHPPLPFRTCRCGRPQSCRRKGDQPSARCIIMQSRGPEGAGEESREYRLRGKYLTCG